MLTPPRFHGQRGVVGLNLALVVAFALGNLQERLLVIADAHGAGEPPAGESDNAPARGERDEHADRSNRIGISRRLSAPRYPGQRKDAPHECPC